MPPPCMRDPRASRRPPRPPAPTSPPAREAPSVRLSAIAHFARRMLVRGRRDGNEVQLLLAGFEAFEAFEELEQPGPGVAPDAEGVVEGVAEPPDDADDAGGQDGATRDGSGADDDDVRAAGGSDDRGRDGRSCSGGAGGAPCLHWLDYTGALLSRVRALRLCPPPPPPLSAPPPPRGGTRGFIRSGRGVQRLWCRRDGRMLGATRRCSSRVFQSRPHVRHVARVHVASLDSHTFIMHTCCTRARAWSGLVRGARRGRGHSARDAR